MKNFWSIIKENRKEAINLMRANNVTKIDFVNEEGEELIEDIPYLLFYTRYDTIISVPIARVRLDDKDHLYVLPNDDDINEEISINEAISASEDNIYLSIEEYFDELNKKTVKHLQG